MKEKNIYDLIDDFLLQDKIWPKESLKRKVNLTLSLEERNLNKVEKSLSDVAMPKEGNEEKGLGTPLVRDNIESYGNFRGKEEIIELSKEQRIEIPRTTIEDYKVKVKGNLHYNPNGLSMENEINIFNIVVGKIESDCGKSRNLHTENKGMIRNDITPHKDLIKIMSEDDDGETMSPQMENFARPMRLAHDDGKAMRPKKENLARSMRLAHDDGEALST